MEYGDTGCVTVSTMLSRWLQSYLHQSHQPKKQTKTTQPEYLLQLRMTSNEGVTHLLSGYRQLKQSEVTYNPVPAAVISFITLLRLATLFIPDGCYPPQRQLMPQGNIHSRSLSLDVLSHIQWFSFFCTSIPNSFGTELPGEQAGCSSLSGACSAALGKGAHEPHGHLFT